MNKRLFDNISCTICNCSNEIIGDSTSQKGLLYASWGNRSKHEGETYMLYLCESCFFSTISYCKELRRSISINAGEELEESFEFGRV